MEHPEEPATTETVQQLSPEDHGRWLVTTKTSKHIWDLDAGTYQRIPGSDGPQFPWDGRAVHLARVSAWPKVGDKSLIWFDDPSMPDALEQWRRSSTVLRIERLPSQTPPAES
jgi:hypothetical protein